MSRVTRGSGTPWVGNDVVDLSNPRVVDKHGDLRFLNRVFTPDEREVIKESVDPPLDLWGMWAAKEAAFKIVAKWSPTPPPFEHKAFAVAWGSEDRGTNPYGRVLRAGRVRYGAHVAIRVEITRTGHVLAALAWPADEGAPEGSRVLDGTVLSLSDPGARWARDLDELRKRLTRAEVASVHSLPSAAVRLGARSALSRAWNVQESRLEIVCDPGPIGRRPPRVLLDGSACDADVSLAHDGAWIAWAYTFVRSPSVGS